MDLGNPLPPLASVRAFEAAARLGSFTRAGAELGMTQAAVSYQIRQLEERLGLPLFLRRPRQVVLTEAGADLARAVTKAFDRLRGAFATLRARSGAVLNVACTPAFASNWLAPRLGAFQLQEPGLAVRLLASDELVDLATGQADVAIRSGTGPWPGMTAHRLIHTTFVPMCSPELARSAGPLIAPADLLRLPLLSPDDVWWKQWFAMVGVSIDDHRVRTGIRLDSQQIEGRAALAGQGVAMLTPALWVEEMRTGRLVQPFPQLGDAGRAYWLIYPEAWRNVAKIRAWRDWLLAQVASGS